MRAAVLSGVGAHLPDKVVTNDDLSAVLDTSDEWIRTRTGIVQRHVALPSETSLHLGVEAGRVALKSSGSSDVDAVVCATTTPHRMCPGTAPEIASRLGLPQVGAFDVQAVCSGFVYGAAVAAGLIAAGIADRVLLVATESIVRFIDPEDRNTAVIFGDGAGAVVLRAGDADEAGALGSFDLGSDGEVSDLIKVDAGASLVPPGTTDGATRSHYLEMDGREVYRRAIPTMVASSRKVLAARGWAVDDIDVLVGHQANVRILNAVARDLGLPEERCYVNIDRVGNTAAASIPLALADAQAAGALKPGDKVLITAFGGGITWGSTTVVWPELPAV